MKVDCKQNRKIEMLNFCNHSMITKKEEKRKRKSCKKIIERWKKWKDSVKSGNTKKKKSL